MYSMCVPHDRVQKDPGGVSLTRQEFAEECDVNNLMARYQKTGVWPLAPLDSAPKYLDLSGVPDFHQAMQLVIDAEAAFMSLPATVRREFDNDAGRFVEFAENSENIGKMREWGLAPPEEKAPEAVEVSPPVVEVPEPAKP